MAFQGVDALTPRLTLPFTFHLLLFTFHMHYRDCLCGALRPSDIGRDITLSGWSPPAVIMAG